MERFTISLDESLASDFDALIDAVGYQNRSEAVRDLIRQALERARAESAARPAPRHSIAVLSYVYQHQERELSERIAAAKHAHHDIVRASMQMPLDHHDTLEAMFLAGRSDAVRGFANQLTAQGGVRHGAVNLISAEIETARHPHGEHPSHGAVHTHLKPRH